MGDWINNKYLPRTNLFVSNYNLLTSLGTYVACPFVKALFEERLSVCGSNDGGEKSVTQKFIVENTGYLLITF